MTIKFVALLMCLATLSTASVQVFNPKSLRNEVGDENGFIEAGMANFGHIDYGSSILGQVFFPLKNKDGCKPFDQTMFDNFAVEAIFQNKITLELPVIMLERGQCTFVTKVRNVEKTGANVAIIGDNREEDSEDFMMSDDGSGHSINIPSFLIREDTYLSFEDSYETGNPIMIKILIEATKKSKFVNVDLWYSTPFDMSVEMI